MKILLDMNIPLKYTALLKQKSFDVLRWPEVGAPDATDEEIMTYARINNFAILTYDLDFSSILSFAHELKPSIIQIRTTVHHAEHTVDCLAAALLNNAEEIKKGAILTIDLNKTRVRLLPII
jgi:predicted nuclease of predicted toxin-antitoxin system